MLLLVLIITHYYTETVYIPKISETSEFSSPVVWASYSDTSLFGSNPAMCNICYYPLLPIITLEITFVYLLAQSTTSMEYIL